MDPDITSVARLTEDEVRAVLAAADSAPTAGGSRPWRFHCTPSAIELSGAGTDHDATLACGAALLNLRLAIHDLGVYADVRLAPDPSQPTLLAVIRPDNERPATIRERQLVRMILEPARIVAGPTAIVAPTAVRELRRAAEIEHAWLVPLSDEQRAALGGDLDDMAGNRAGNVVDNMVVVVGSLHDDLRALLRAGQAVQRVVLTAAVLGLHTSVARKPVATAEARDTLRTLIGGALSPHAVLTVRPA